MNDFFETCRCEWLRFWYTPKASEKCQREDDLPLPFGGDRAGSFREVITVQSGDSWMYPDPNVAWKMGNPVI